jgi:hypothetical protein
MPAELALAVVRGLERDFTRAVALTRACARSRSRGAATTKLAHFRDPDGKVLTVLSARAHLPSSRFSSASSSAFSSRGMRAPNEA